MTCFLHINIDSKDKEKEIYMFQKLEEVEKRYEEVTKKISDPEVISKQEEWKALMKEHAEIEPDRKSVV